MADRQSLLPEYRIGDATAPTGDGLKTIAHVCNNVGAWGSGFVVALSRRWEAPERAYRAWPQPDRQLGAVQYVDTEPGVIVANMVAQDGIGPSSGRPPIRYEALADCLTEVGTHAAQRGASVHMPRIGCGLAGGRWSKVEPIVRAALCERGVPVVVYDLPGTPGRAGGRAFHTP